MSGTSSETISRDDSFSDLYKEEENYWWSKARRSLVNRFLKIYLKSPEAARLLDVGCGGGGFLNSLKGYGNIFGLEHSALGAVYASKTGAKIVRGDAQDLPFKDRSFDALISLDVIEHLNDDAMALRDFSRLLTDGGVLILTVPAFKFLWSPRDIMLGHKRRYTSKKLELLLNSAGFKIIRCSYTNSFYFPILLLYSFFKRVFQEEIKPETAILSAPPWISILFGWILKIEEGIISRVNLPIGTSILCVAEKMS